MKRVKSINEPEIRKLTDDDYIRMCYDKNGNEIPGKIKVIQVWPDNCSEELLNLPNIWFSNGFRICEFDEDDQTIQSFSHMAIHPRTKDIFCYNQRSGVVHVYDSEGNWKCKFSQNHIIKSCGMIMSDEGLLIIAASGKYIFSRDNYCVKIFNENGDFIFEIELENFSHPRDIAVDIYGNIFVVDIGTNEIKIFKPLY